MKKITNLSFTLLLALTFGLTFISCDEKSDDVSLNTELSNKLTGVKWQLFQEATVLNGKIDNAAEYAPGASVIEFKTDGRVAGKDATGNYSGAWRTLGNEKFSFDVTGERTTGTWVLLEASADSLIYVSDLFDGENARFQYRKYYAKSTSFPNANQNNIVTDSDYRNKLSGSAWSYSEAVNQIKMYVFAVKGHEKDCQLDYDIWDVKNGLLSIGVKSESGTVVHDAYRITKYTDKEMTLTKNIAFKIKGASYALTKEMKLQKGESTCSYLGLSAAEQKKRLLATQWNLVYKKTTEGDDEKEESYNKGDILYRFTNNETKPNADSDKTYLVLNIEQGDKIKTEMWNVDDLTGLVITETETDRSSQSRNFNYYKVFKMDAKNLEIRHKTITGSTILKFAAQ